MSADRRRPPQQLRQETDPPFERGRAGEQVDPATDGRRLAAGLDPSGGPAVRRRLGEAAFVERMREALADLAEETGASRAFVLSFRPEPRFGLVAGDFPELTRGVQQASYRGRLSGRPSLTWHGLSLYPLMGQRSDPLH